MATAFCLHGNIILYSCQQASAMCCIHINNILSSWQPGFSMLTFMAICLCNILSQWQRAVFSILAPTFWQQHSATMATNVLNYCLLPLLLKHSRQLYSVSTSSCSILTKRQHHSVSMAPAFCLLGNKQLQHAVSMATLSCIHGNQFSQLPPSW